MRCLLPGLSEVFRPRGRLVAVLLAWSMFYGDTNQGWLAAAESDSLNSSTEPAGPELLPRVDELPARTAVASEKRVHSHASARHSRLGRGGRTTGRSRPHHGHRRLVALTAGRHRFGAGARSNQPLRRKAKRKNALQAIRGGGRYSAHRRHSHSTLTSRTGPRHRRHARLRAGGRRSRKRIIRGQAY